MSTESPEKNPNDMTSPDASPIRGKQTGFQTPGVDLAHKYEQKLIKKINRWRYTPSSAFDKISKHLGEHKNGDTKTIDFPEIGKTITYENEKSLEKLLKYLKGLAKTT